VFLLFFSINFLMKYPGGQSSDSVRDDRELTLFLTESEFCPPKHHQHTVCAIKSNFLTFPRIRYSPVPTQSTPQRKIRGDRVPTLSGMIGTHTIFDRIGILSSQTSSAYSLCNKIKFPDFPSY